MAIPKWVTPERQAHLVKLFVKSKGFRMFGESPCKHPESHHYVPFTEAVIKDWIQDDREARAYMLRLQRLALHRINERGSLRGTFNAISRDIYFDNQPQYQFEGIGISGLTFKPFAKVRLASSFVRLHVDIVGTLKGVSKNRKRKAVRYCKALPVPVQREVERLCARAVINWLNR